MVNDINYKTDILAISENNEKLAVEQILIIEQSTAVSDVSFIKDNFSNKKIRDRITEPVFNLTLGIMMAKICALSGVKSPLDDISKQDCSFLLKNKNADLSLEEIWVAFRLERYGDFGERTKHYDLFDAVYISTILLKYRKWKADMKQVHNLGSNQNLGLVELSDSAKDDIIKQGVIRKFHEFSITGIIKEPHVHIFDYLMEKGLIKDWSTPALMNYYISKNIEAAEQLKTEYAQLTSPFKLERKKYQEELDKIMSGHSAKIEVRIKRNILIEFFKKHLIEEIYFEKLINDL